MDDESRKDFFKAVVRDVLEIGQEDFQRGVQVVKQSAAGRAALNVVRERDKVETVGDAIQLFAGSFLRELRDETVTARATRASQPPTASASPKSPPDRIGK